MLALHKILVKKDKTREKLDFYTDTLEQFFNSYNMPFCNIFFINLHPFYMQQMNQLYVPEY